MGDVTLSALLSTVQIQSVSTSPATGQKVPQEIANLPQGSLLKGFVVNRDAQNNPILRTNVGDILVKSDVFLKTGSEVVIRVNTQSNQMQARIVSVDSIPIKEVIQQQQALLRTGDQIAPSSVTSRGTAPSSPPLSGIILQPANFGNPQQTQQTIASILKLSPSQVPQLDKGLQLEFRIVGGSVNQPTLTQPATAQLPASQTALQQPAAQPTSQTTLTQQPLTSTKYGAYTKLAGTQPLTSSSNPFQQTQAPPSTAATAAPTSPPTATAAASGSNTASIQAAAQTTASLQQSQAQAPALLTAALSGATATTPPSASAAPTASPAPTPPGATAPTSPTTNPTSTPTSISNPIPLETASPRAGTLSARVIGAETNGETVVRTSIGTIRLFTPSAPPVGTTLTLELVPSSPSSPPPAARNDAAPPPAQSAQQAVSVASRYVHDWDSLEQTHHLLRQDAPAQAQQFSERIPNTKSQMVNSVLFFLSALRSGDVRRWLGNDTAQKIDERSGNLLQRLSADFGNLRLLATDQPETNWQMLFFPLMHDDELHQARLFVRQDENGKTQGNEEDTRFILEVTLSELGELQIDGLMHKTAGNKQFDLVIRSEKPLEEAMKDEIRSIYLEAADIAGYSGQLRFAHGYQNMLHLMHEMQHDTLPDDGSILA